VPDLEPAQITHQASQALHPQPEVGAGGADLDPLDQHPHDPRLLGREQLVPQRVQPLQRLSRLCLGQVLRLGPRRPPGADHDFGLPQFVAYAVHPDTGRAYEWPTESLVDVPLDRLPVVSEAQCAALLDAAWQLLPDDLRQSSLLDHAPSSAWRGPSDPRGTLAAIEAALAHLPNDDLPWDDWFRVGMALKGALGDEGSALWEAWSAQSRKDVPATTAKLWRTARPHSIGAGTIYWLAEQRGWIPAPSSR